jgi:hypothetical protein
VTWGLPIGVTATSQSNGSVTLSGTPLVPGLYTIWVKASNSVGTRTSAYSLWVSPL